MHQYFLLTSRLSLKVLVAIHSDNPSVQKTVSMDDALQTLTLIDIHLKADRVCVLIDISRQPIPILKLSSKLGLHMY